MNGAIKELRRWIADDSVSEVSLAKALLWAAKECERFTGNGVGPWEDTHDGIRHGIIRLAAHKLRTPDARLIPVAVEALWRPYRFLRSNRKPQP